MEHGVARALISAHSELTRRNKHDVQCEVLSTVIILLILIYQVLVFGLNTIAPDFVMNPAVYKADKFITIKEPFRKHSGLPRTAYRQYIMNVGVHLDTTGLDHVNLDRHQRFVEPRTYDNQTFSWFAFNHTYAFPYTGVLVNDSVYYPDPMYFLEGPLEYLTHRDWRVSGVFTVYRVGCVLNILHWGFQYGHYIIDYLPLVTTLSDELRLKCHVILPLDNGDYPRHLMKLFGFQEGNIHVATKGEIYFADVIYTTDTIHCQKMFVALMDRMRQKFAKALKLDVKRPSNFVLYNRRYNRVIQNMDAIQDFLAQKFPDVVFDMYRDEERMNLSESMKWADRVLFYNQALFLFGMHGSGTINALFMQTGTVLLEVETGAAESWSCVFASVARIRKLHFYTTRDKKWSYHWKTGRSLPLGKIRLYELLEMSVKKAVELAKSWEPRAVEQVSPWPMLFSDGSVRYLA